MRILRYFLRLLLQLIIRELIRLAFCEYWERFK